MVGSPNFGFEFGILGSSFGLRVAGFGFRGSGFGLRHEGLEDRCELKRWNKGVRSGVEGSRIRVQGSDSDFRVWS